MEVGTPHPVNVATEEQTKQISRLPGSVASVNIVIPEVPLLRMSPSLPRQTSIVHRHPSSLDRRCPALAQVGRGGGGTGDLFSGRGDGSEPASAIGCTCWRRRPCRTTIGGGNSCEDDIQDLGRVGGLLGAAGCLAPYHACLFQSTDLALGVLLVACRCRIVSSSPSSSGLSHRFGLKGSLSHLFRFPTTKSTQVHIAASKKS